MDIMANVGIWVMGWSVYDWYKFYPSGLSGGPFLGLVFKTKSVRISMRIGRLVGTPGFEPGTSAM